MKNLQRGSVSLMALLFASFLMSLGGAGAAAVYFQKNPNDFMTQLHSYVASRVNAEELAPLDTTPTSTPTPSGKPSITGVHGDDEEEIHESNTAKLHEHEHTETEIGE